MAQLRRTPPQVQLQVLIPPDRAPAPAPGRSGLHGPAGRCTHFGSSFYLKSSMILLLPYTFTAPHLEAAVISLS